MSFAVAITKTQTPRAVVIQIDWIKSFNKSLFMNSGLNKNKKYLIFYSVDIQKTANFDGRRERVFQENGDACYDAQLYAFFGKYRSINANRPH